MKISIRVTPKAKGDEILGWKNDVLRIRVKAPPVDGRANAALVELLAKTLRVPKTSVRITIGLADRRKTVEIDELDESAVRLLFPSGQSTLPFKGAV